jgi:hypothetical protein
MRKVIATLIVASLSSAFLVAAAQAAQTQVNVRIEGRTETLFEGPVLVEPDGVQASSDATPRSCNGINTLDPWNVVPEPTPTAASADALGLIGETFDGQWYPGFNDYFITRWGPDLQRPGESAYWGILVNDTFTNVGGCQYQLDGGDEVLWVYDAFQGRPNLALFPEAAHYATGPRPLTATTGLNEPIAVEVVAYEDDEEDNPAPSPGRIGSSPFPNAAVSPVLTSPKGFEKVDTGSPLTQTSDGSGKATFEFAEAGWHRIKATVPGIGAGPEEAVRSNRLDICVTGGTPTKALEGALTCDQLPAADRVRVAPRITGEVEAPSSGGKTGGGGTGGGSQPSNPSPPKGGPTPAGSLQISVPKLDRKLLAKGKVGLSWKVTDPGPGVRAWTVASLTLGKKHAKWVTRAKGSAKTAATIRLPKGHAYKLRFAITDRSGQTSTVALGTVKVPKAGHARPR